MCQKKIDEHSDDPNGIMDTSILLGVIQAAISEYPKDSFEAYTNIEEVPETVVEVAKEEINLAVSKEVVPEDADVPLSTDLTNEELKVEEESNLEISHNSEAVNEAAIADIVSEQETTPDSIPVEIEAIDELNLPLPSEAVIIENANETCENDNIDASHEPAEVGEGKDLAAPTNEESGTVTVAEDISHEKATEMKEDNEVINSEEKTPGDECVPDDDSVQDLPAENSEEKLDAKVIEETPGTVEQVTDNIEEISQDMIIKVEETITDTIEETTSLEDVSKTKDDTEIEEVDESVEIDTDKTVGISAISAAAANEIEEAPTENVEEDTVPGLATIEINEEPNTEVTLEHITIEEQKEESDANVTELTGEETTSLEDVSNTKVDPKIEETIESVEIDTEISANIAETVISANSAETVNEKEEALTENVEEETVPGQEIIETNEEPKTELSENSLAGEAIVDPQDSNSEIKEETAQEPTVSDPDEIKDTNIAEAVANEESAEVVNNPESVLAGEETDQQVEQTELTMNQTCEQDAAEVEEDITIEQNSETDPIPAESTDLEVVKEDSQIEASSEEEHVVVNEVENELINSLDDKEKAVMEESLPEKQVDMEDEKIVNGETALLESDNTEIIEKIEETELTKELNCEEVNKDDSVQTKDEIDSTETCEEETSPAMETSSNEELVVVNKVENEVIIGLNEEEKVVIKESLTEEQVDINVPVPEETSDNLMSDTVNEEESVSDDKIADTSCEEVAEPLDAKSNSNEMLLETETVEENPQSDEVVSEATVSKTSDEASDDSTMVEFEAFNKETQSPVTFLIDSKMLEKLLIRSESRVVITNFEVIPSGPVMTQSGDSAIFSQDEASEEKKPTEEPDVYTEFADQQRKINFAQIHNEKEKPTPKTPPTRNVPVEAMSTNLYLAGSNIKFDLDEKLKIIGTPVSPGANIIWKRAAMV